MFCDVVKYNFSFLNEDLYNVPSLNEATQWKKHYSLPSHALDVNHCPPFQKFGAISDEESDLAPNCLTTVEIKSLKNFQKL